MYKFRIRLEKIIDESYEKELKREKTGKSFIRRKAGKAFVGFFVIILILTVIARAADSMTVTKVKTTKIESTTLTYKSLGTGSIVAGSKKYIYLDSGIRVEKILRKEGDKLKVNDEILKINLEDTKKKLKEAETELKKLELSYQEKQLETKERIDTSGLDNAEYEVEYAKQDLEDAKESYKEAKDNYENASVKQGENVLETKTDEYEKAKYDYEQEIISYDDSIEKANRSIEDAQRKIDDSQETLDSLENCINGYADSVITQNYTNRDDALKKIYIIAFGSKEEYEKYQEDLADAQNQKSIADSSYESSKLEWKASCDKAYATMQQEKATLDAMKKSNYKTEEEYITAYNKQLAIYYEAKKEYDKVNNSLSTTTSSASSSVSAASATLSKLKKKTDNIQSILGEYVSSKRSGNATLINAKLEEVDRTVLGDSAYKTLIKQIAIDGKALEREKEDYELQKRKLDMSLEKTKNTMDKAKMVLDSVKNGTYDYKTELESYEQAVETAKKAVKSCERALEKAESGETTSRNELNNRYETAANTEAKNAISLESARIDIEVKQEAIDELEAIIESDGIVRAEIGGIIVKIGVEEGKITAADSPVVTLSTGGYSFEGTMSRKEAEKIAVNDSCYIRLTGSQERIETTVEYMENIADEANGEQTKVIATLPEGDYVVGSNGDFSVEKASELYDSCISLNAIREDNRGKFVLIIGENESILGKETVATRMEVTVLDKDSKNAVIESGLTSEDRVISESNKDIKEGDRVRVMN
ncbi:MAG TPA: HlyD family efflux transporter periplasmic adaptor subunit [Lachnospiraceae bacterium]|nr:HlyD family efflux transporter periplasmic adaptor subunit [Lachnospiraceae bacterium]